MFFITCIKLSPEKFDVKWEPKTECADLHGVKTCWGYHSTFEMAKKVILENLTDIYEFGSYNLAVIEEIDAGIPAFPKKEWWFSAEIVGGEGEIEKYEVKEIEKPKRFEGWAGWALS